MLLVKLIYRLTGHSEPVNEELDDEIDRLLLVTSAEYPTYLMSDTEQNQLSSIDSEVLSSWIKRKFEPALIRLLLEFEDNYKKARSELVKMERYHTIFDKILRTFFVEKHASQRAKELIFDTSDDDLKKLTLEVKRTLTFLANNIEFGNANLPTLQGTDKYTSADVTLYCYLKRIVVGKYKDLGLKSHVRGCYQLVSFMKSFASKNPRVLDVSSEDPLANRNEESSLLSDMTTPAFVAIGFILFYLWRIR